MPPPRPSRSPACRYPWAALERAGDSFFIETAEAEQRHRYNCLAASIPWQTRHTGRRYIVRVVAGGVRCWLAHIPDADGQSPPADRPNEPKELVAALHAKGILPTFDMERGDGRTT